MRQRCASGRESGTGRLVRHRRGRARTWIAKEKLRDALNLRARVTGSTPCERNVRDRLFSFYLWCARLHQGNTAQDPGRDQEASTAIPGKHRPG